MKYVNEHGQAVLERASQDVYDVIASQQGDWTVDSVEYSKKRFGQTFAPGHLLMVVCSHLAFVVIAFYFSISYGP